MIVWFTQLGLSVALPPAGFIFLASWLHRKCQWGAWVLWVGILLGVVGAIDGLRVSLKAMAQMSEEKNQEEPPVSFNEHD